MFQGATPLAKTIAASVPTVREFNAFEFFNEELLDLADLPQGDRQRESVAKRYRAPLFIGLAAAAVIVIVGAIIGVSLGGRKPPTNDVAQHKEDEKPKIPEQNYGTPRAVDSAVSVVTSKRIEVPAKPDSR